MSFFQTEKGKITTGVLAAVLATTAIMVPVSIFSDRAVRGAADSANTQPIETYSYAATAGTTTNGFGLAGIGNGDNIETIEWLNKNNEHYHDLLTDQELIDGVIANDGLAFGNRGIVGTEWDGNDAGTAETNPLILVDENGEEIVDHNYDTALSVNMKVTSPIADVLMDHMITETPTALTVEELDDAAEGYGSEIATADDPTAQQFAVAFGFINYASYAQSAFNSLDASFETTGIVGGKTDEEVAAWWKTTFADAAWSIDSIKGTTFQLAVDGSSTVNPAFESVVNAFNASEVFTFDLHENLNNSGSTNSWGFDKDVATPGMVDDLYMNEANEVITSEEYDALSDEDKAGYNNIEVTNGTASAYTFLGTSSSLQYYDSAIMPWGYASGSLKTTTSEGGMDIADITALEAGSVIEATIAVDGQPTFYTSDSLRVVNPSTGNKEQPVGITKAGIRLAYIYGASWNLLATTGNLQF